MKKERHEVSIVHSFAVEYLTFINAVDKSDVNAVCTPMKTCGLHKR